MEIKFGRFTVMHTVENLEPGTGYIFKVLKIHSIFYGARKLGGRQISGETVDIDTFCGRPDPLRPMFNIHAPHGDPSHFPFSSSDSRVELRGPQRVVRPVPSPLHHHDAPRGAPRPAHPRLHRHTRLSRGKQPLLWPDPITIAALVLCLIIRGEGYADWLKRREKPPSH